MEFLAKGLALCIDKDQKNWDDVLDSVLFTYRSSLSRTLNNSPFFLIYCRDVKLPHDLFLPLKSQNQRKISDIDIDAYKIKQLKVLHEAYEKLNKIKERDRATYKNRYDKTHKPVDFKNGDFVWLYTEPYEEGMTKKFLPFWDGPFKITGKQDDVTYRIESMNGLKTNLVTVQRLRKVNNNSIFLLF